MLYNNLLQNKKESTRCMQPIHMCESQGNQLHGWICKLPCKWSAPQERMWSTPTKKVKPLSLSATSTMVIENSEKSLVHMHPPRCIFKNRKETKQEHANAMCGSPSMPHTSKWLPSITTSKQNNMCQIKEVRTHSNEYQKMIDVAKITMQKRWEST